MVRDLFSFNPGAEEKNNTTADPTALCIFRNTDWITSHMKKRFMCAFSDESVGVLFVYDAHEWVFEKENTIFVYNICFGKQKMRALMEVHIQKVNTEY